MPRACPHCSAALPEVADAYCPQCRGELPTAEPEAPPLPLAPPPEPLVPAPGFRGALCALTPRAYVTLALIALNVAMFARVLAAGVPSIDPLPEDVSRFGAVTGREVVYNWWAALLHSAFVHFGVFHLVLNLLALATVGVLAERVLGNRAFVVAYVASALGSSLASLLWNWDAVLTGASGAVCGAFGAILGALAVQRRSVPPGTRAVLTWYAVGFVAYNVALALLVPYASFAAHVGGLLFGFVLGALMNRPLTRAGAAGRGGRVFVGALVAVLLVAASVWLVTVVRPGPIPAMTEMYGATHLEMKIGDRIGALLERLSARQLAPETVAAAITNELLPEWRAQRERVARTSAPRELEEELKMTVEYMRMRERAWEAMALGLRTRDRAELARAEELHQIADEFKALIRGKPAAP